MSSSRKRRFPVDGPRPPANIFAGTSCSSESNRPTESSLEQDQGSPYLTWVGLTLTLEPEEELQVWDSIELVTNRGQMDQYNSKELRALVMVMRYSGLRISDAVTLDHTQLVTRESGRGYAIKVMDMQKTHDWVRIPITPETVQALKGLKFKGEKNGRKFWFYTGNGERDTAVNNWR